jgi:valyl-tRNA synthetase
MALDAPQATAEYKFLLDISTGIRSLLSRYDFKEASTILVQTYSRRAFQIVLAERTSLLSLGGKYLGKIVVLGPSANALPPRGCALQSINSEAAVCVQILGHIDLAAEWGKRAGILDEARKKVGKSRSIMSWTGWEKANEQTKSREGEKLANAQSEVARMEETLHDLERLQLEFDE